MFTLFAHRNGTVSKKEFRHALYALDLGELELSREECDSLFESFDTDGTGELEYSEFSRQLRDFGALRGKSEDTSSRKMPTVKRFAAKDDSAAEALPAPDPYQSKNTSSVRRS